MIAARTIAVFVFGLALASQQAASAAAISGNWQLDIEHSDDIRKMLKPKKGKDKKHAGKAPGPGADGPGGPHANANPTPTLSATNLEIKLGNNEVTIIPDKGAPITIVPDGRAAPVSLSNWGSQGNIPVRFSTWEGETLVMESSLDEGTHITQSYSVNAQGLLVQSTELDRAGQDPIEVNRRFKPAAADQQVPEPAN